MTIHREDNDVKIVCADSLEYLKTLPANSIDSIVTDPPYEIGFMGRGWDDTGIAYNVELWRECLRVLKPGGHALVFGATRTYHRVAVAIEDAGFEIRDSIHWMYGSGFPKSMDISKAIDKTDAGQLRRERDLSFVRWMRETGLTATKCDTVFKSHGAISQTSSRAIHYFNEGQPQVATAEMFDLLRPHLPEIPAFIEQLVAERTVESENYKKREVVGQYESDMGGLGGERLGEAGGNITAPATEQGQQWQGWGTALKPAHEPIVVARKPLDGTVANNVLTWGVGGLNIDGSRVGGETITQRQKDMTAYHGNKLGTGMAGFVKQTGVTTTTSGRFPANILLTHNVDCEIVGEQTNERGIIGGFSDKMQSDNGWGTKAPIRISTQEISPVYRCTQGCPVAALDEQSGVTKSASAGFHARAGTAGKYGGNSYHASVTKSLGGIEHGDQGGASRFFTNLDHDDEQLTSVPFVYSGKAPKKERPIHPETGKGHPTVKPLSVMRWLIKLVTPAGGVVLDPFAGSGATVEAALLDGYRVIGIDITEDHMPLIDARIDRFRAGLSPVKKPKVAKSITAAAKGNSKARKQATAATAVQEETLFDDLEETS